MSESDATIREIRKEVIEARGLVIQTHNLIENLNSEMVKVAKRQVTYGRRYFLNSIIGYMLLVAVIGTSLYYIFDMRVQSARKETVLVRNELDDLQAKVAKRDVLKADRERAGQTALAIHESMVKRKNLVVAANSLAKLQADDLDPVARRLLQEAARGVFLDEGTKSFEEGRNQARRGRHAESIPHFDRAIALGPTAPFAVEAYWRRGYALYRENRIRNAITDFEKVLELDRENEFADEAAYHMAYSQEMLGEKEKAIALYNQLLTEFPRSDKAQISRRKVDQLTRQTIEAARKKVAPASKPAPRTGTRPKPAPAPAPAPAPMPIPTPTPTPPAATP